MFEALGKIPKGVNLIIFIWAVIGLVLMLRDPKIRKEKFFYVSLALIGFMMIWRIVIGINSSRYASGLILPFAVFAAYLLYDSGRKRHFQIRLALYIALICSGFFLPKMIQDSVFRNTGSDVMAEMFKDLEQTHREDLFRVSGKDFSRILYASHLGRNLKVTVWDEKRDRDRMLLYDHLLHYDLVNPPETLLNVDLRTVRDNKEVWDHIRPKIIASLIEDTKKDKKQLVLSLTPDNQCVPIPESRIAPYQPNLLDNGDLEELDTPEESFGKLKVHLLNDSAQHSQPDPAARTPRSAFFALAPDTDSLPEVNVQNDFAIAGNHSARIHQAAEDGNTFLMFDKRFSNGEYEYSMLIQGETDTFASIICEVNKDGKREIRTIATLYLLDKRLFQVKTHFSVEDLGEGDYFLAGVSVKHGEAYFDNFSLTRSAPAAHATSDGE